jgi:hypothetical protein
VVLADGIQQSKFSGLLIDPPPQGSVN